MNQSNLVQEILSARSLFQNNTIGIILGERISLDTAAAALALYLSLKEAGKNPQIISKKEPTVEIANLVGVDKIKKSFTGNSNRVVVSLPYNRGEIGKVSYKEENDRINFYLTAIDGKNITAYEQKDINLIWDGAMPSVIVTIGVNSVGQLSEFVNTSDNSAKIINIDNLGESFGDISIVSQDFSSVSEIVAKIIRELKLSMNIDVAQNLLDGILYATRNFTKPNTSSYALESAGFLMQNGAVRSDSRNTNRSMSVGQNRPKERFQNQNQQNRPNNQNTQNLQSLNNQSSNSYNQQFNQNRVRREELPRHAPQEIKDSDFDLEDTSINPYQAQDNQEIPSDWLMPKVFKGSQNIDDLK